MRRARATLPTGCIAAGLLAAALCGCARPGVPSASAPPPSAPAPSAPAPSALAAAAAREIGYATVADAHAALAARRDVAHTERGTYEVFVDDRAHAVWLFTLPGSAAYPALVHRQLVGTDAGVVMRSFVFCEAEQVVCTLLQENARLMDAAILDRLDHGPPPAAEPAPEPEPRREPPPGVRT